MNSLHLFLFTVIVFSLFFRINCFSRVSHQHRDSVLLISLDGIHAGIFEKYLKNNINSSFNEIINTGVKAEFMIPIFPTGIFLIKIFMI